MNIILPYKVDMSVNAMYYHSKNCKVLKPEALMLRAKIMKDTKDFIQLNKREYNKLRGKKLTVGIRFKEDWMCKNGEMVKKDIDNRLKFLIDSIFRALEMDDKQVWEIFAEKVQWIGEEKTDIIIKSLKEVHKWNLDY